jgi:hypothetical protein
LRETETRDGGGCGLREMARCGCERRLETGRGGYEGETRRGRGRRRVAASAAGCGGGGTAGCGSRDREGARPRVRARGMLI